MCEFAEDGHDWKFKKQVNKEEVVEPGVYRINWFGSRKVVEPEKLRIKSFDMFVCPCGASRKVLAAKGTVFENSFVEYGEWVEEGDS